MVFQSGAAFRKKNRVRAINCAAQASQAISLSKGLNYHISSIFTATTLSVSVPGEGLLIWKIEMICKGICSGSKYTLRSPLPFVFCFSRSPGGISVSSTYSVKQTIFILFCHFIMLAKQGRCLFSGLTSYPVWLERLSPRALIWTSISLIVMIHPRLPLLSPLVL